MELKEVIEKDVLESIANEENQVFDLSVHEDELFGEQRIAVGGL